MRFGRFIEKLKGTKPIGAGTEKKVFVHPHKPERVLGVYKRKQGVEAAKDLFYASKIAHLLFPKNIPNVHMVTTQPSTIEKERFNSIKSITWEEWGSQPFRDFRQELSDAGIEIDDDAGNLGYDSEQNIVYKDDIFSDARLNKDRLQKAVEARLSGEEQRNALNWLERISSNPS